jgi:hypothetical protein
LFSAFGHARITRVQAISAFETNNALLDPKLILPAVTGADSQATSPMSLERQPWG